MQDSVAKNATDSEPEISEIAALLAVVERRSYGAAARALGLSKSTVSRRIGSLEDKLGVRLLQRSTRNLALTELGHAYHERVMTAVGGLREAAAAVREQQGLARGLLRMTAPVDLGRWLAGLIVGFRRAYPQVAVQIELTQRAVDLVGEGFDAAIRAGYLRDSALIARPLLKISAILVASDMYLQEHGKPRRPADLGHHQAILFRRAQHRGQRRYQLENLRRKQKREVVVSGQLIADDFNFVRDAALAGAGIALVPELLIQQELERGELIRVLPSWRVQSAPLHLVYPSRAYVPAKLRAFAEFAASWIGQNTTP